MSEFFLDLRVFRSKSDALLHISQVLKVPLAFNLRIPKVSQNLKADLNVVSPATLESRVCSFAW